MLHDLAQKATYLLKELIQTPSLSREEDQTAIILQSFLEKEGYTSQRHLNNIWIKSSDFQKDRATILLNSHHDTVKPNAQWTRPPFEARLEGDQLFGLGSNDAGASLVSLLVVFLYLDALPSRPYNLIWLGSAEEEISGKNGVESVLSQLGDISFGIVGEPTLMQMAIAEKGLMVLDAVAEGKAGHAAREEGINAIYKALVDIQWAQHYKFAKESELLGKVKMSVTQIEAGSQHNVVPNQCKFVIDVRTNELYSNAEVFEIIQSHMQSQVKARSFRLNSSCIDEDHPLIKRGKRLGWTYFGSPTLSDQALMSFPTLKLGPGDSARSHTADEFIYVSEIEAGIGAYIDLLEGLQL